MGLGKFLFALDNVTWKMLLTGRVGHPAPADGPNIEAPSYKEIVRTILTTFAVFTGATIKTQIDAVDVTNFCDWHWWALVALLSLLLRYIIGSAVHLNYTYAADEGPKSRSVILLFKDLIFLVGFGMLALFISYSQNPKSPEFQNIQVFVFRSSLFIGAGFIWSVTDYVVRRWWCRRIWRTDLFLVFTLGVLAIFLVSSDDIPTFMLRSIGFIGAGMVISVFVIPHDTYNINLDHERPGPFWRLWIILDGFQFLFTFVVFGISASSLEKAILLAIGYVIFLFCDILAMVRAIQLRLP